MGRSHLTRPLLLDCQAPGKLIFTRHNEPDALNYLSLAHFVSKLSTNFNGRSMSANSFDFLDLTTAAPVGLE